MSDLLISTKLVDESKNKETKQELEDLKEKKIAPVKIYRTWQGQIFYWPFGGSWFSSTDDSIKQLISVFEKWRGDIRRYRTNWRNEDEK
jgi:hypothetical protein